MVQLTLILDNLRSAHNVGAILRSCDAAGVERVLVCGTTPYPRLKNEVRDPVVASRNSRAIAKTALGAEKTVMLEHYDDSLSAIAAARAHGCTIYGLEQTPKSTDLFAARPHFPAALVVGNEVTGIPAEVLAACDAVLEIPQHGSKESLNVAVAAGIALYALRS
jgi:23S rRNA (guanosine2251-2'-O)-methyltransferase